MVVAPSVSAIQQGLAIVARALQSGNLAAADAALAPFFLYGPPADAQLLNAAGVVRANQGRLEEAASLFGRAATLAPREPVFPVSQGRTLANLGRVEEAEAAFRVALKRKPDFADAFFELGSLQHRTGRLDEAERTFRQAIRAAPRQIPAKLGLASVLVDAGRPADAEPVLRRGLTETSDPRLKAQLYLHLSVALRRQRKDAEALAACDSAAALDPTLPNLALHRAEALQNLKRHDEALAVFKTLLARNPGDPGLHHAYNDLLYRLGREDEFLKSYDRAPPSRPLLLGKAYFLGHGGRNAEAHAVYAAMLARDPQDRIAAIGVAKALMLLERPVEAGAAFDTLLARGGDAGLMGSAAQCALQAGDPQKAAWLCEQGLAQAPRDGTCIAMLSIAARLMEDGRDESLNGYDTLVRSFDLEPPDGFSDMASFNAELDDALDRQHSATREFIDQSLRGGTQTPDNLFGAGHALVEKLRQRIDDAVARYVAELPEDAAHPFLSRRTRGFHYAGSWSSRLRDCGFHVNHIHPMGWISSCYYVAVPGAVADESQRQGWIKFGEPSFTAGLQMPVRRVLQPAPGRLVLFPSYMWHGTVAFRDTSARTTIAFDVVPTP